MTERLLQYIWQFQYFNHRELQIATGESLHIMYPGQWNSHQGPDFLQATLKIGDTVWVGNIELHVQASDWLKHAHHRDKNYDSVILHVVWENDHKSPNDQIPLLCLQDRIPKMLLSQYEDWMMNRFFIPCEEHISTTSNLIWLAWKERLLVERMQRKTAAIQNCLVQTKQHWEETFWWLLARNFGMKVNAGSFEALAKSLPVSILVRHKNQIHQLEALLFGQARLLENNVEEKYPRMLQKEYRFYKKKYKLHSIHEPVHFLRMRPGSFPTIRLAQLAMLIHQSSHLFSRIIETPDIITVKESLNVTANDYWHYHYIFDETSTYKPKNLGEEMVNNIIINTIVPIVFAYGSVQNKNSLKNKALKWIEQIPAEKNSLTRQFSKFGIVSKNAFDTQSIIELKNNYCDKRRCLDCAVGNSILKRTST